MKKFIAFTVASLLAVAVPFALTQNEVETEKAKESKTYTVGSSVDPKITLPDLSGKDRVIGDYKGQLVVVDFWSINCPFSKKKEQQFIDLHKKFADKGVAFLAIDSNKTEVDWDAENPYAEIQSYVERAKVTMTVLVDRDNKVADLFGGMTTPHVYILDKAGVVRYTGLVDDNPKGAKEEKINYVAQALEELLAGEEVSVSSTKPQGCSIKRVDRRRIQ